jgi:CBS domain-containing protein
VGQSIKDVMHGNPVTLPVSAPVVEAARCMKEQDIGDVLVVDDGRLCGMVTDRDIVVRAVAGGRDLNKTPVADVCTSDVATLSPTDTVDDAVRLMRERNIRRVPVVENDRPVGIVTIGDLAIELDSDSALADISAARPNN